VAKKFPVKILGLGNSGHLDIKLVLYD
jgi:hypothetical protein